MTPREAFSIVTLMQQEMRNRERLILNYRVEETTKLGVSGLPSAQRRSAARYLALDVGTKRIGVAISDPLGLTAQPLLTMTRKANPREDLRSLSRMARQHGCTEFIIGLPLLLSGESSAQTERVRRFAAQLADYSSLPIRLWDERLTSQDAHAILYAAGKKRQQHAALVDQVAAVLILQSFLDHPDPASVLAPAAETRTGENAPGEELESSRNATEHPTLF